jgi:hypothetical protein
VVDEIRRFLGCSIWVGIGARSDELGSFLSDLLETQISVA